MNSYLFFDSASTTPSCEAAVQRVQQFTQEDFGNPASSHVLGLKPARAIRSARVYFSELFHVEPEQVIFTGSGTEANNLAIYGIALAGHNLRRKKPFLVLTSPLEHPSVRKTVQSLSDFGIEPQWIQVQPSGIPDEEEYKELIASTVPGLISIQLVNHLSGTRFPVEKLAQTAKSICSEILFHSDCIQAFGKIQLPRSPSSIDLISISAHKIGGPKGVGALICLNSKLVKNKLIRPLLWGGDQEFGLRSGTQNAGLIAGFHAAAEAAIQNRIARYEKVERLRSEFKSILSSKGLTGNQVQNLIQWNSPDDAVPHIVSLSIPGCPAGPLARVLEEKGCIVSVGSACSSKKPEPDLALSALGFSKDIQKSTIRISFSHLLDISDMNRLAEALVEAIHLVKKLTGKERI